MATKPPTARILAALGLLVVVLGAIVALRSRPKLPQPIKLLSSFELIDRDGSRFGSDALADHVWIAGFIYTSCPGPCPALVSRMHAVDNRLNDIPGLRLVLFSVDPQTDNPAVLRTYASTHKLAPGRWKLLTGDAEMVIKTVRENFLLGVGDARVLAAKSLSQAEIADLIKTQGPVTHSLRLVLVDKGGAIRGYYQSTDSEDVERLIADARLLSRL